MTPPLFHSVIHFAKKKKKSALLEPVLFAPQSAAGQWVWLKASNPGTGWVRGQVGWYAQGSVSCLLVYPCSDPWPLLPCASIVGRRVALSMMSQHPLHVMVGGAQQGAFGVKKAGEGELAAKIDAPISICMLVTSVIQRNPGPIRAQGGPMQRGSEGGLGSRAFWGVGGGSAILY